MIPSPHIAPELVADSSLYTGIQPLIRFVASGNGIFSLCTCGNHILHSSSSTLKLSLQLQTVADTQCCNACSAYKSMPHLLCASPGSKPDSNPCQAAHEQQQHWRGEQSSFRTVCNHNSMLTELRYTGGQASSATLLPLASLHLT